MIQENLECCGSKDMFDYDMPMNIPKSCCSAEFKACSTQNSHEIGCRAHIQNLIRASSAIIAYSCIGVAIFQLMGAIMGFILSGYIKKVRQFRRCCCWVCSSEIHHETCAKLTTKHVRNSPQESERVFLIASLFLPWIVVELKPSLNIVEVRRVLSELIEIIICWTIKKKRSFISSNFE